MSNFHLTIENDQFNVAGYKPEIDTDKFGELLEFLVGSEKLDQGSQPNVLLQPWQPILAPTIPRYFIRALLIGGVLGVCDKNDITVSVLPPPKQEMSNETLLHESKHWSEFVLDTIPDRRQRVSEAFHMTRRNAVTVAAAVGLTASAGLAAAEYTPYPEQVDIATLSAAFLVTIGLATRQIRRNYRQSGHEARAFDFAANPDITNRFGGILTVAPNPNPSQGHVSRWLESRDWQVPISREH